MNSTTRKLSLGTALVPLVGSGAGSFCDSKAALGGRAATAGFGVSPREDEEGRSGEAAPRSGAKRRPDFGRAVLRIAMAMAMVTGCTAADPERPGENRAPMVFGQNDHMEVYEDDGWRAATARGATAIMVNAEDIEYDAEGSVSLRSESFGQAHQLCENERFYAQPTTSGCSATLIGEDLVLTAGHCISNDGNGRPRACPDERFVFNYFYESAGVLATIRSEDVYGCKEVVARVFGNSGRVFGDKEVPTWLPPGDHAIVRLDRRVVGRAPVKVQSVPRQLDINEPVVMIGYPAGLPAKIDAGGSVKIQQGQMAFYATTDSFPGNSGSGIYDGKGVVVGTLKGWQNPDYCPSGEGPCNRICTYPEDDNHPETSMYAYAAVQALCTYDPSYELCEGVWVCDAARYGTGDGCDRECGAPDPDCND